MFEVDIIEVFAEQLHGAIATIKKAKELDAKKEEAQIEHDSLVKMTEAQAGKVANLKEVFKDLQKKHKALVADYDRIASEKATIVSRFIEQEKKNITAQLEPMIKARQVEIERETEMYQKAYDCLLSKYKQARGH